ncbi:hypothetical protein AWR36_010690 [Microbulbifer flavimaris]|uniref:Glycosyl transferase family 28 C-terminal domain-containing protein n=1 Tax=Microbulbifer flavimaris TaxID=1781068 RepID=A0ABX4HYK1_9GAMM|nr:MULTISPECIES: glycosyltransferase [Microbulbifer]KUJ83000.1 hypothetical protein AVO43_10670 [Microbulbifer sp. ZGT114]PCO05184.1 hypothetical protein AWR36_010690 [Microbulbifer flavimaris]
MSLIFLTTGTRAPFDRLVRIVDHWAEKNPGVQIVAQIGTGRYRPRHIEATRFLCRGDYQVLARDCRLMIAHAGMGSVLSALEHGKPLVMMPRNDLHGECTNDHQFGTARRISGLPGVYTVHNAAQLIQRLDNHHELRAPDQMQASPRQLELAQFIMGFIKQLPQYESLEN